MLNDTINCRSVYSQITINYSSSRFLVERPTWPVLLSLGINISRFKHFEKSVTDSKSPFDFRNPSLNRRKHKVNAQIWKTWLITLFWILAVSVHMWHGSTVKFCHDSHCSTADNVTFWCSDYQSKGTLECVPSEVQLGSYSDEAVEGMLSGKVLYCYIPSMV